MFHLMLVLTVLILGLAFLAVLAFMLIFAVAAIAVAVIGGTSVAMLVKNKLARKLLILGFLITFLIGADCLLPVFMAFAHLSSSVAYILALLFGAIIVITAILGIKNACKVSSTAGKVILIILFSLITSITAGIMGFSLFFTIFVAT